MLSIRVLLLNYISIISTYQDCMNGNHTTSGWKLDPLVPDINIIVNET